MAMKLLWSSMKPMFYLKNLIIGVCGIKNICVYRPYRMSIHSMNFLTAVGFASQSKSKLYLQKNNYAQTTPVRLARYVPYNTNNI